MMSQLKVTCLSKLVGGKVDCNFYRKQTPGKSENRFNSLADPGFGQGGAPEIFSEILPT